jgi:hypothetical protein
MQGVYSPGSAAARAGELGGSFDPSTDTVKDYGGGRVPVAVVSASYNLRTAAAELHGSQCGDR